MSTSCPQCHAVLAAGTRFCTNCGSLVEAQDQQGQPAAQTGWSQPQSQYQSQQQAQVPPWAAANPGQQSWGGQYGTPLDSLGFGSQNTALNNDAVLKKALLAVGALVAGALVLLLILGLLAAILPSLRCFFGLAIIAVLLVPWFIYVKIRRSIRRTIGTIGRIGWFF